MKAKGNRAADATAATAAGGHNTDPDYNAGAEADQTIRSWLEGQVGFHQQQLKDALVADPRGREAFKWNQRAKAYSAAMITAAGQLLDHLDAEAKQAR